MSPLARRRLAFLLLGGLAFLLTEFGRFVYRPWAYAHEIRDYGLADSVGNLGGIVVQIFAVLIVAGQTRRRSFVWSGVVALGYVLYEFLQPYLPRGTFDWKDVLATAIGWAIAMPLLVLVWRLLPDREPTSGAQEIGERST